MDEVTQQNAALVEEAAAASKSLEDQGRQLTEAVAFFRVDGAPAGMPVRSQPEPVRPAPPRALAGRRISASVVRTSVPAMAAAGAADA